jgi:hypothetical protein
MRRFCLVFLFAACDSPSTMMNPSFKRDGGLVFENGDMTGMMSSTDLAAMGDLAKPPGDMATGASCTTTLATLSWDFEASDHGFTHAPIDGYDGDFRWEFDEWERGTPAGSGPGACHGGSICFGTFIGGNYASCERAALETPTVNLTACAATNVKLVFWHWFDFWTGSYNSTTWYDGGIVELSGDGGATWSSSGLTYPGTIKINPDQGFGYSCLTDQGNGQFYVHNQSGYVQSSSAWVQIEVPIPASLRTANFRARWAYSTGVSSMNDSEASSRPFAKPGWYVDDVAIVTQ